MARKAESQTQKARKHRESHDLLMARAICLYQTEQQKDLTPGEKRKGLRTICKEVEIEHRRETGDTIVLNHNTLRSLANGGRKLTDFNASKGWLLPEEETMAVDYAIETAKRGFPLTHRRLRDIVNEICRKRLGSRFPKDGVGRHWTQRFMDRHSDRLRTYRARILESKRGEAVNETTNAEWFKLLGETLESGDDGAKIAKECIWATDETGFQPSGGPTETVIGAAGQKTQYQQRDGTRENITVIVTIGADGSSIPPAVIFKGQSFQAKWKQDNPADASLGYSKKGWTDGEIGVAWIEHFEKQTREKANGRWRLLLVDGHNSHYTQGFLDFARQHRIHVLCYPSHTTHIYQGLDVVVFSVLKRYWSEERDEFERETGEEINKGNFLAVYGRAHIRALTPDLIAAAFRKTGVVPFNPHVVTKDMMAPSREKEWKRETILPLQPPTPVRIVSNLITNLTKRTDGTYTLFTPIDEKDEDQSSPTPTPGPSRDPETPLRNAMTSLASTNVGFLTRDSPVKASSEPPRICVTEISPFKPRYTSLTTEPVSTKLEETLQEALRDAEARVTHWKTRCTQLQSQVVLQEFYVKRVRRQLAKKEAKKDKGKNRRLNSDGKGKLLTKDEFYQLVVDHEDEAKRVENEKEARRLEKKARSADFSRRLREWEEGEAERKDRNEKLLQNWQEAVDIWEAERDLAKSEKRRPRWKKPTKPKLEKAAPKPKTTVSRRKGVPDLEEEEDTDANEDEVVAIHRPSVWVRVDPNMDSDEWVSETEAEDEDEDEN